MAAFAATATDLVDGSDPVIFKEGTSVVHSGDSFALGSHTITASATDHAGNVGSESFTITVRDTTPPSLSPIANQVDEATGPSGAVAAFAATATDLVDGSDPVIFKEGTSVVHSGDSFATRQPHHHGIGDRPCRQCRDRKASPSRCAIPRRRCSARLPIRSMRRPAPMGRWLRSWRPPPIWSTAATRWCSRKASPSCIPATALHSAATP